MLRYRLLGPSGLRVSEICLGTMSFGTQWGFGAEENALLPTLRVEDMVCLNILAFVGMVKYANC